MNFIHTFTLLIVIINGPVIALNHNWLMSFDSHQRTNPQIISGN